MSVQGKAVAKRTPETTTTRRAKRNKRINQQLLREKIASQQHLSKINKIIEELMDINASAKRKKFFDKSDQAKALTRIGALRTALDGQFRLLAKYLPDLRSIALENEDGSNPLAAAAKAWAEALDRE